MMKGHSAGMPMELFNGDTTELRALADTTKGPPEICVLPKGPRGFGVPVKVLPGPYEKYGARAGNEDSAFG
jgi:hypothetical protein